MVLRLRGFGFLWSGWYIEYTIGSKETVTTGGAFKLAVLFTKVMRTLTIALVGQLSLFKFIAVNLFGTPKQIDCNKESCPSFSTSLFLICAHCIGCYCCETLCHSNTVCKLDSDARTHSLAHTGTWYWMLRIT